MKTKNNFQAQADELKPRERIERAGTATVASGTELLAILLKTGTAGCDVMELSRRMIDAFGGVEALVKCDFHAIKRGIEDYNKTHREKKISGIGRVKILELAAAFELARRGYTVKKDFKSSLQSSEDVANLFRDKIGTNTKQETFWVLPLDARRRPISEPISIAMGTLNGVSVHPRDVFALAVRCNAHSIVVAHNHPSGSVSPSRQDISLTKDLFAAGELMGIPLFDHLILTDLDYYSFADEGKLKA